MFNIGDIVVCVDATGFNHVLEVNKRYVIGEVTKIDDDVYVMIEDCPLRFASRRFEHSKSKWIEWNGGECPINEGERFNVILRFDTEYSEDYDEIVRQFYSEPMNYERSLRLRWNHIKSDTCRGSGDIIAYKIVE